MTSFILVEGHDLVVLFIEQEVGSNFCTHHHFVGRMFSFKIPTCNAVVIVVFVVFVVIVFFVVFVVFALFVCPTILFCHPFEK